MKNFVLGAIAGVGIAVGCYKPYQIEMEYRNNIAAGLGVHSPYHCFSVVNNTMNAWSCCHPGAER